MLDRAHRLTTSSGFIAAARRGRRAGTRTLVLHLQSPATPSDQEAVPSTRVGFVVGRSVGNAVHRNGVKRRLRELSRARLSELPEGAVLVVRALPAAAAATYSGLATDFDQALRRLGVSLPPAAGGGPALEAGSDAADRRDETAGAVHGR